MEEHVILVDEFDNEIGTMPKLEAHQKNELHRAFSIFIWNSKNEMLLQKRASGKYHSPNLWTNACCSHPRKNESTIESTFCLSPSFANTLLTIRFKIDGWSTIIFHFNVPLREVFL